MSARDRKVIDDVLYSSAVQRALEEWVRTCMAARRAPMPSDGLGPLILEDAGSQLIQVLGRTVQAYDVLEPEK